MRVKPVDVYECTKCDGVFYASINKDSDYCPYCGEESAEHTKEIEIVIE